jgi:transposase
VFTAIVYVLTSGCAWRDLPPSFGVSFQTGHRRFGQWTRAGLWRRLHQAVLDELGARGGAGLDVGDRRRRVGPGEKGLGQRPRQPGAAAGHGDAGHPDPARAAASAGRQAPRRQGLPFRRDPGLAARARHRLADRPSGHRITRAAGTAPVEIERSIAWLFGHRRLTVRYERKGSHFLAFLGLAAILTGDKKLAKLATRDVLLGRGRLHVGYGRVLAAVVAC